MLYVTTEFHHFCAPAHAEVLRRVWAAALAGTPTSACSSGCNLPCIDNTVVVSTRVTKVLLCGVSKSCVNDSFGVFAIGCCVQNVKPWWSFCLRARLAIFLDLVLVRGSAEFVLRTMGATSHGHWDDTYGDASPLLHYCTYFMSFS